jgi:hypothetical protein
VIVLVISYFSRRDRSTQGLSRWLFAGQVGASSGLLYSCAPKACCRAPLKRNALLGGMPGSPTVPAVGWGAQERPRHPAMATVETFDRAEVRSRVRHGWSRNAYKGGTRARLRELARLLREQAQALRCWR